MFHNEDWNGATEVVYIALLVREGKRQHELDVSDVQEVEPLLWSHKMYHDKDLLEREVLKERFPSVATLMCVPHTSDIWS